MSQRQTISITGARSGAGTTTTCIALALLLEGVTQLVGTPDDIDDLAATSGGQLTEHIHISQAYKPTNGITVIDGGSIPNPLSHYTAADHRKYLLVRGPSYPALRTAQRCVTLFDGVILLTEEGRALDHKDVTAALRLPVVAKIKIDKAVHRLGDAGITRLAKLPKTLDPLRDLPPDRERLTV